MSARLPITLVFRLLLLLLLLPLLLLLLTSRTLLVSLSDDLLMSSSSISVSSSSSSHNTEQHQTNYNFWIISLRRQPETVRKYFPPITLCVYSTCILSPMYALCNPLHCVHCTTPLQCVHCTYHISPNPRGEQIFCQSIFQYFSCLKVWLKHNRFYITIVQVTEHKKTNKMVFVSRKSVILKNWSLSNIAFLILSFKHRFKHGCGFWPLVIMVPKH